MQYPECTWCDHVVGPGLSGDDSAQPGAALGSSQLAPLREASARRRELGLLQRRSGECRREFENTFWGLPAAKHLQNVWTFGESLERYWCF